MRRQRAAAAALAAALLAAGCSDGRVEPREGSAQSRYVEGSGAVTVVPAADREAAPAFSGPLLDGGTYELAADRGEVVVLNVWGSWCAPCRKEARALQAVADATHDLGVRFVGVNTRDTEPAARAFLEEFGVTYPTVVDPRGERLLAFRDTLPPAAIPSTLVVDREGRVAARVLGEITETSLTDLVTDVAAGAGPTAG
jgi:thiol-disulfide isomerase/thioredoxin